MKKDEKTVVNELTQYCDSLDENCPVILLDALDLINELRSKVQENEMIYGSSAKVLGELIRCAECKYRRQDWYCTHNHHEILDKKWYCGDGKRKKLK